MSSFQLESIRNIPSEGQRDLKHYTGSSESSSHDGSVYPNAKKNIAKNQTAEDVLCPEL